ncbi:type IV conjugative transfer system lipoprotein TraV [Sphingobium sp.]|uniref:type IV conjugative transfer system lipoprotein TraV n=1 Tax=Sphingobium sp. TaxID=1912891 RepID=UPI002CB8F8C7|nr:type IV conjugative transfer system lipoprotein TraV [Sphingobium sp.]HUD93893.1 type IV conjugative transfer system lipoprotein TraV [Sphingobium sp.]
MTMLRPALLALPLPLIGLSGCAAIGSVMSPYSEKFSCKNSDHGQCIHPDQAYADALAGRPSRSAPAFTNDRKLLVQEDAHAIEGRTLPAPRSATTALAPNRRGTKLPAAAPFTQPNIGAVVESPSSPMLRPSRTVRTLILPYADKQRPGRLYLPRYIYSIVDKPAWVVGDYLVEPGGRVPAPPVLRTARESDPAGTAEPITGANPEALEPERRP